MANYYGFARSNYFRVKDLAAFEALMDDYCIEVWKHRSPGEADAEHPLVAIAPTQTDDGCWPSQVYLEDLDDWDDLDLFQIVADHLVEGEVAVFVEAGAEKLRYISGYSVAVDHHGYEVRVSLDEIYDLARAKFGTDANISIASY